MKYEHILWCKDEKTNADKVWGIICLNDPDVPQKSYDFVTFWGRRGKALQTKVWNGHHWDANYLANSKISKGYKQVNPIEMDTLYPEFEEDLEKTAVWAMLKA